MTVRVKFKTEYVKQLQLQLKAAREFNKECRREKEMLRLDVRHWKESYDSLRKLLSETNANLRAEREKTLWTRIKEFFTWN